MEPILIIMIEKIVRIPHLISINEFLDLVKHVREVFFVGDFRNVGARLLVNVSDNVIDAGGGIRVG